jgi:glycosyltransferase involved in cell wall biosynthesis
MRTLEAFAPKLSPGEAEVIVVPNGCTDDTAALARTVGGVDVLDVAVASKAAALNAGDQHATALPRIFLDADIVLPVEALRALAGALEGEAARVAAPEVRFALAGRPWSVRAFYAVYQKLPYASVGLTGLGVYGLSAAGRARFTEFPSVTADDLFVQRLFSADERVIVSGHFFDVETPKNLRSLVAVRTRTAFGNRELSQTYSDTHGTTSGSTMRAMADLVRSEPKLAPAVVVYVGVTVVARLRARRRSARTWQRDQSTR